MVKLIKILIIFYFSGVSIANEIVNQIVINGNQRISDETVKIYGDIKLKKNINENEINKILRIFTQQIFLKM